MTLQNDNLNDFIVGEGYTICLVQNPHSKKAKLKACDIMSESVFPAQDQSKSNNFMISSIPSINIAEVKKGSKSKSPQNFAFFKTEVLRENSYKYNKRDSNTPTKNPNHSKSPYENKSNSKSPVSRYVPHAEHQKQKSLSNCKPKKELTKVTLNLVNV